MSFRLDPAGGVGEGVRTLTLAQLDKAAVALARHDRAPEAALRDARRRIKRARALLQLAEDAFGRAVAKALNRALRDAARGLSPLRDGDQLPATVASLMPRAQRAAERRSVSEVAKLLPEPSAAEPSATGEDQDWTPPNGAIAELTSRQAALAVGAAAVDTARDELAALPLAVDDFDGVRRGLARTYRHAKAAGERARTTGRGHDFHDWRKLAQRHARHLQLLSPAWPAVLMPRAEEAKSLARTLGRDHDLSVLDDRLHVMPVPYALRHHVGAVRRLIAGEIAELRPQALSLGRRLFAESPPALVDALATAWAAACDDCAVGCVATRPADEMAAALKSIALPGPADDGERAVP